MGRSLSPLRLLPSSYPRREVSKWKTINLLPKKRGGQDSMAQSNRKSKAKFKQRSPNVLLTNPRRKATESITLRASSAPRLLMKLSRLSAKSDAGGQQLVSRRLSITSFG